MYLLSTYHKIFNLKKINKKKIVYLDDSCLRDEKLCKLNKKRILVPRWKNKEKLRKDIKNIQKDYKVLIKIVSKILNDVHNENNTSRYWQVIVGAWLLEFYGIFYITHKDIKNINFKNIKYHLGNEIINEMTETSHYDFKRKRYNPEFVYNLVFRIIKSLKYKIKFKKIVFNKKNIRKYTFSFTKIHSDLPTIAYDEKTKFRRMLKSITNFLTRNNSIFFDTSYIPIKIRFEILRKKMFFFKAVAGLAFSNIEESNQVNNKINSNLRNFLDLSFKKQNYKKFKTFFSIISNYFPKNYIENYEALKKKYINYRNKTKIIFSAGSFIGNDNFKIWAANKINNGAIYFLSDHGSGFKFLNTDYDFYAKSVADFYNNLDSSSISSNETVYSPKIKKGNFIPTKNNILIVFNDKRWIWHRAQNMMLGDEILYTYKFIKILCKKFANYGFKNFILRPKITHGGIISNLVYRDFTKNISKNSRKYGLNKNIERDFLNSKLVICTYPQTSFIESIATGMPTILLYPKKISTFVNEHKKIEKKMLENEMLFHDPNRCFDFIKKRHINIYEWWNSPKIILVRNLIEKTFIDQNNLKKFEKKFRFN